MAPKIIIMPDKTLLATLLASLLFLASGAIELAFSLSFSRQLASAPLSGHQATRLLLYRHFFPLTATTVNAALIIASAALAVPGLVWPRRGMFLCCAGYAVTLCALFTMGLGLYLWILTLRLRQSFAPIYVEQDSRIQSLIQISFSCCGYDDSSSPGYVTDPVCPGPAAAALARGCSTPVSNYANTHIDLVFTALFGMVGIDALLILAIACLLKTRKEAERYRLIDEKSGYGHF